MSASNVTCLGCKQPLEARAWLAAFSAWDNNLDCVVFRCPHCNSPGEARLETSRFTHGYVYAAGNAHFSAQMPIDVPGLAVEKTSAGLVVKWDGAERIIPLAR
jgi:hypothetical protein